MRKILIAIVVCIILTGCVNPPQYQETQDVRIEVIK